jgi:hypothetical protein
LKKSKGSQRFQTKKINLSKNLAICLFYFSLVALYSWLTSHFYRAWQFMKAEVSAADIAELDNGVVLHRVHNNVALPSSPTPPPHYAVGQNAGFFEMNVTDDAPPPLPNKE